MIDHRPGTIKTFNGEIVSPGDPLYSTALFNVAEYWDPHSQEWIIVDDDDYIAFTPFSQP